MNKLILALAMIVAASLGFGLARKLPPGFVKEKAESRISAGGDARVSPVDPTRRAGSTAPASASPSTSSEPSVSTRILDYFLPGLSESQLRELVKGAFMKDGTAQHRILDIFQSSNAPSVHALMKECFSTWWWKDAEILQRCVDGLRTENHRTRKLIWAEVVGEYVRDRDALHLVEEILAGRDAELQGAVLKELSVGPVREEEDRARVIDRLRGLVMTGGSDTLRAAAAASLRGDSSETGIRFLIDRALRDPANSVRMRAVASLPASFSDGESLLREEVLAGLYSMFIDPHCNPDLRRWVTYKLEMALRNYEGTGISPEQRKDVEAAEEAYEKSKKK